MSGLHVRGITKRFGSIVALNNADLDVPVGTLMAVLGPSGCGKTTLLRMIAGFERPDAGSVAVGGHTLVDHRTFVAPEKRRLGLVPQEGALFPHLSVARNIAFGLPRGESAARVAELLDLVGLPGIGTRMPHELSGGQQQRVALARALAPRPEVVLLDEPFAALDAGMRAEVRAEVRSVLRAAGATAVLVTHDQEEALSTADRVAVMAKGRVAQTAAPEDLYQQPVDLATARFLGDSIELPATAASGVATTVLGAAPIRGIASDGSGIALIRPEQLRMSDHGVAAAVTGITFYGHDALVEVELVDRAQRLNVRTAAPLHVGVGDPVYVELAGPVTFFQQA